MDMGSTPIISTKKFFCTIETHPYNRGIYINAAINIKQFGIKQLATV
jgi:hypothetical protein